MNAKTLAAIFFAILAVPHFALAESACTYDSGATPGLPTATCGFPSCPSGFDCLPPTINKQTANISYSEPAIQWRDSCPDTTLQGACWEVHMDFTALIAATDPSGVSFIGVNLASEVNNKRTFKTFWGQVAQTDSQGRYSMTGTVIAYVPPGQQLLVTVYELCSRDGQSNEGCVFPLGRTK